MKTSQAAKMLVLMFCIFLSVPKIWAQDLDDVEADMDTAISESDAAQSAEEFGRKSEADEKSKLSTAKKEAAQTSAKSIAVKDASQKRLAVLEKKTSALVAERKLHEAQTAKAKKQIEMYEEKVKLAEATLAAATQDNQLATNALKNAEDTIAANKKKLQEAEANRKKELAAAKVANRKLASIAGSLPGKKIVMAKDCALHAVMDLNSPHARFLKKGEKIELAKVGGQGWFQARTGRGNGFMHKTCK